MKPAQRRLILPAIFLILAILVIADRSGPGSAAQAVVEAAPRTHAAAQAARSPASPDTPILPIAPRSGYGSSPDGFFGSVRPPAPPPPPPEPLAPPAPATPSPPYRVIGKQLAGGQWEVFLAMGDASLIAHAGERLDADWRVLSIRPPVMELEYVPNKQRQTLAIGADFND
ncbi:hypothetical protein OPU71_06160 [Niveibacterium sp. 24ML]|uniref:hypothetical protein n=1 Tax=Niveibacterium sp. 24ML TaxID=2985512 RepID=UPI00227118AE|nr:hypothetical protein [Niveibacterium sp. 24ML]MCX9155707.1 hypothetical protein [Niveibacterium sp. 24ML]